MYDPTADTLNELSTPVTEESLEEMSTEESQIAGETGIEPTAAATPALVPTPVPVPKPLPITRPVSGRYRGRLGSFEVELRVDIDRTRPMKKVSGDFYSISGATMTYFGSFIVDAPAITTTATQIVCRGLGRFTWAASAPVVQVAIPRRTIVQPPAPAQLQFFTKTGAPGATYVCAFESIYFRTVQLETDRVSDITLPVFTAYNTGSLPSGGASRNLSIVAAYAEAGIEMRQTPGSDVINVGAEAGATWSDAELHASMEHHFSLFRNVPQWAVWQVVAQNHDLGSGLLGIMFDQAGPQRQGCAVFHRGLGGTAPTQLRLQLQTYVHELGHCFNLLHSWQKSLASPPGVNRPNSLSWMNYPWRYAGGESAFWGAFAFQFDDGELIHLRHAFRAAIVMGGNPFAVGAGEISPELMADPIADASELRLEISMPQPNFALGEPVVLNLALSTTSTQGKIVHGYLHPNMHLTTIAIAKPNGQVVSYEPWIEHLVGPGEQELLSGDLVQDSAYIGFGKGGLYFDQPGTYRIRAIYHGLDGAEVYSNVLTTRVRYPVTAEEERLAGLLIGEEQGALFYLMGSDAESLTGGRAALEQVMAEYDEHPVAHYVRLVQGVNLTRAFKTIERRGEVRIRQADTAKAASLLSAAASQASPIDVISKSQILRKLSASQEKAGDKEGARKSASLASSLLPAKKKRAAA